MNVLILTGRFGMGHYSAAEAIRQEILVSEPNANIYIVDIIDYMFPSTNRIIYSSFNFMVGKCSYIYNFLNDSVGRSSSVPLKKIVTQKIDFLLNKHQIDLVVATLPICSQYISAYKEMTEKTIPLYTYITDITAHDEWITKKTDLYFVGADSTKNTLISKGISPKSILVSGIPVKQCFKKSKNYIEEKTTTEILIMGGGLGLIPSADDFLDKLCSQNNLHITMITGKNEKLMEKIKTNFPKIDVMGYTNNVFDYMNKADLLITKSGGITTFEAIYCSTPLYIIKPFLIQEIGNAEYIENFNFGRVIWSNENIANDIISLTKNKKLLKTMKKNMMDMKRQLEDFSPIKAFYKSKNIA